MEHKSIIRRTRCLSICGSSLSLLKLSFKYSYSGSHSSRTPDEAAHKLRCKPHPLSNPQLPLKK